ncbi:MAG: hypothetical protein UHG12_01450 [Methanobrevibacter sp.]|nr:hypothetical protein [Methanobrevibacter sp.]MEE1335161.1 hypothetical protein [Methanobrevibacter sp.]
MRISIGECYIVECYISIFDFKYSCLGASVYCMSVSIDVQVTVDADSIHEIGIPVRIFVVTVQVDVTVTISVYFTVQISKCLFVCI